MAVRPPARINTPVQAQVRSQLSRDQFTDSYRKPDFRKREHVPRDDADRVYGQLAKDYPSHALRWVHDVDWDGPKKIPLDKLDWENEQTWRAEKEQAHVQKFVDMIESGEDMKPIIAIDRPGKPTMMIPDGHHRALAYKQVGKPVLGYVGRAKHVEGPWDYLHNTQFKDSAKDRSVYR